MLPTASLASGILLKFFLCYQFSDTARISLPPSGISAEHLTIYRQLCFSKPPLSVISSEVNEMCGPDPLNHPLHGTHRSKEVHKVVLVIWGLGSALPLSCLPPLSPLRVYEQRQQSNSQSINKIHLPSGRLLMQHLHVPDSGLFSRFEPYTCPSSLPAYYIIWGPFVNPKSSGTPWEAGDTSHGPLAFYLLLVNPVQSTPPDYHNSI